VRSPRFARAGREPAGLDDPRLRVKLGELRPGCYGLPMELRVESLCAVMVFRSVEPAVPPEDQPDRLVPLGDVRSRQVRLVTRREAREELLDGVYARIWRGL